MKTSQYVRQLRSIEAADNNVIREWWMFGLRLLRDPEVMAASGASLKHGVAEQLIAAAGKDDRGRPRLSAQKIQRALRCARAYGTESQIRRAATDFDGWYELVDAGFPAYEPEDGEPLADHRTDLERKHDRAHALADLIGEQGALFPVDRFEPSEATLKDLLEYTTEMAELTARFARRDAERREYVEKLIDANDGDLSVTWDAAHERVYGESISDGAA